MVSKPTHQLIVARTGITSKISITAVVDVNNSYTRNVCLTTFLPPHEGGCIAGQAREIGVKILMQASSHDFLALFSDNHVLLVLF